MKVFFFAGGLDASLTARILPLAKSLSKYNVDCQVIPPILWSSKMKGKLGNVFSVGLSHSPKSYLNAFSSADIVIINRFSSPQICLLQKALKKRGIKVIFDLDDALFLPTSSFFGAKIRPGYFSLEKVIKNSDFVTVNGQYLLNFARKLNKNVEVIPDPVDTKIFFRRKKESINTKLILGWEGVGRNHYCNLSMIVEPLAMLAKEHAFKLSLVSSLGDPLIKQMFKPLEKSVTIDYGPTRWVPLIGIADLISNFDIMLCPLKKTAWYEGKSASRVGMGMAMGIPVIASPVGEQKYVVQNGVTGYLAADSNDWYTYLKQLLENGKLRQQMGDYGRQIVESCLSIDTVGKQLNDILENLAKCR
jgi:glycosyltransferase involved in cell wall biosynthesis